MSDKHTPEPWRIGTPPPNGEQTIGNEKGLMVAVATAGHGVNTKANARRIVACVNACAGIPTASLESMEAGHLDSIHRQRDELLAEFNAYKEGSEEAFGAVVEKKQSAEARLQTMQSTIYSQQGVICDFRRQRDELLADVERCYRMLLSEPDTKGALFKAENILREAIASAKESK